MDEESGTRFDQVGTNHLTERGTVTSVAGKVNRAAQFVATDSAYLDAGDTADLSTGDVSFGIAAWVYLDSLPSWEIIASKYGRDTPTQEWDLAFADDVHLGASKNFLFGIRETPGTGGAFTFATAPAPITTGTWNFVAGWYDASADTVNIQVNNGPVTTTTAAGALGDTVTPFFVGAEAWDSPTSFFDGRIDEVGFWKRPLTTEDLSTLYEEPGVLNPDAPSGPIIPEPSSLLLIGIGLLGLAGWRRRLEVS